MPAKREYGTPATAGAGGRGSAAIPGYFGSGNFKVLRGSGTEQDPFYGVYTAPIDNLSNTGHDIYLPLKASSKTVGRVVGWSVMGRSAAMTVGTVFVLVVPVCYNTTPDTTDIPLDIILITDSTYIYGMCDYKTKASPWLPFTVDNRVGDWWTGGGANLAQPLVQLYPRFFTTNDDCQIVIAVEWFEGVV